MAPLIWMGAFLSPESRIPPAFLSLHGTSFTKPKTNNSHSSLVSQPPPPQPVFGGHHLRTPRCNPCYACTYSTDLRWHHHAHVLLPWGKRTQTWPEACCENMLKNVKRAAIFFFFFPFCWELNSWQLQHLVNSSQKWVHPSLFFVNIIYLQNI